MCPTGFKNIAMEMELLKEAGREEDFLFGFEESLGYLYGNYTRDKDGVLASQMIATIAACLKAKGMTLFDRLAEMYRTYGYAGSKAIAIEFRSEKDREKDRPDHGITFQRQSDPPDGTARLPWMRLTAAMICSGLFCLRDIRSSSGLQVLNLN